ncbi:MAG TPA: SWIM zinc finger family protein, partial [Ktedonobacteraceae bacterium]|nr:SWIM zinc finger family protein [Ktedonobacteraceae bacterium]
MGLQLTSDDQVLALAPDSSAASAGKKLAQTKHWKSMGQSTEALWGECQGSGKDPYQVRVDLANLAIACSCPSRKLPCKHALGLLLITVDTPKVVPTKEPPEWVSSWLAKRAA